MKTYLGDLCRKQHDHDHTGQSLRYLSDRGCVECRKLQRSKWKKDHPERMEELQHKWNLAYKDKFRDIKREKRKDPFERSRLTAYSASINKKLPFDLTAKYLKELWTQQEGKCYWLGLDMDLAISREHAKKATIDRLVPEKGYVEGNVVWATRFANFGRGTTPQGEFWKIINEVGSLLSEPTFDQKIT